MAVRREAVRLELEDHFTREVLQAAAATKVLDESLHSLSGSAVRSSRSTSQTEKDVDGLGKTSRRTGADIDRLSGRVAILAKVFATLGPAIAPIGAVGVAGIAGLASEFGFATAGALSLLVAAQGVGDALKAVEAARLEPTAANIEKAEQAMRRLAPEARAFVTRFQELRPVLGELQQAAARGWFPGLTSALDALESAAPRLERIMLAVSTAGGEAISAGAQSLAGPRWSEFFSFVEAEAPAAITALASAVGSLTHGFAELWMAFDPINDGVRDWLVDISRSFDEWATGLDQTEGFHEFIAYVQENGPRVADAVVAITNAILQIAEAAAPLGGPVLEALTSIANAIALIADSPLGTPIMAGVTAMSALSIATNVATSALGRFTVASTAAGAAGAGAAGKGKLVAASLPVGLAAAGSTLIPDTESTNKPGPAFNDPFVGPLKALLKQDADQWAGSSFVKKLFGGDDKQTVDDMTAGVFQMGSAFDGLADSVNTANDALAEQSRVTLGAFSAETQYREALKAAAAQAKTNNAGIKGNSDAALENRQALEQLAGAWQNQRAELAASGAASDVIERKQRAARRAFIDTATAMGVPIAQAKRLAKELLGIPASRKVDVSVDDNGALTQVNRIKAAIEALRGKTLTIDVVRRAQGMGKMADVADARGHAAGGLVTGPGGPTDDMIPTWLSNREFVIRASAVDKYGVAFFEAANAERLAAGGQPGKTGKPNKNKGSVLGWNLDLGLSLKDWIRQIEASKKALEDEVGARESAVQSLQSEVTGKFTSDLFGNTDIWSAGGSLADATSRLLGDTAGANAENGAIARLRALGLTDNGAMSALLAQADPATVANIASTATAEELAKYQQAYQARVQANAGLSAQVAAGWAAQAAAQTAELQKLNAQISNLTAVTKDVGPSAGKATGSALKKGAGNGSRNRKRG
ncbi:hypothetical protein [Nocardioides sp. SLBN-35]|uniref:hypothetical protein n=1 Tax=Nocardioides sp. SLBN-35 TaxID=2768445 RepID=UPI00115276BD|nr:hypothetical protein [Nocardioides sp. SLBN-35]TQK73360.1 hypothetical protein FBY23_5192 [Nocardioides sp. SLBN-35]